MISTEAEFGMELDRMMSEVAQCVLLFYQYIEIHNHAAERPEVFRALNQDAAFWNTNLYALQQAMFISLGRIFDSGKDSHSIYKLLKAAQNNREFFFKRAFRQRRIAGAQGVKPEYLEGYVAGIHIPTKRELYALTESLKPAGKKYLAAYADVRNLHVGHTIENDRQKVDQLFSKVVISETRGILYALSDVLFVLREVWQNGKKPILGKFSFTEPERIAKQTHAALDKLIP